MSRYRILGNGAVFYVQYLGKNILGRPKWKWVIRYHPMADAHIAKFYSITDAETCVRTMKIDDAAKAKGLKVVAEY